VPYERKERKRLPIRQIPCVTCGKVVYTRSNRLKYCYKHSMLNGYSSLKKSREYRNYRKAEVKNTKKKYNIITTKRTCLKCGTNFRSESRFNRICEKCNSVNSSNKRPQHNVVFDNGHLNNINYTDYTEGVV